MEAEPIPGSTAAKDREEARLLQRLISELLPHMDDVEDPNVVIDAITKAARRTRSAIRMIERDTDGGNATYVFLEATHRFEEERNGGREGRDQLIDGLTAAFSIPERGRTKIALLSCTEPMPRKPWMSRESYDTCIRSNYLSSFAERMRPAQDAADADTLTPIVRAIVARAFGPGIRPDKLFGKEVPATVSRDLWESLLTILSIDIAMALRGKHDELRGRAFSKLACMAVFAIPLGTPTKLPHNEWILATI